MRHPLHRTLCVAAATVTLSGCATGLRLGFGTPIEYEATVDGAPTPSGTPLVLVRRNSMAAALGWQDVGLYVGTGFVASNALLAAAKFQDTDAAAQWAAVAVGTAIVGDYLANTLIGAGRRNASWPQSLVMAGAEFEVPVSDLGADRFRLMMPLLQVPAGETANLSLLDDRGRIIGRASWNVPHIATASGVNLNGVASARRPQSPAPVRSAAPKPIARPAQPPSKPPAPVLAAAPTPRPTAATRPVPARRAAPPKLSAQIGLDEPVGDGAVHAGDGGTLVITVANAGKTHAFGVIANLKLEAAAHGLTVPAVVPVGDLAPGATQVVRVPIGAERGLRAGRASLQVVVEDINRFDAPPARLAFDLRAYEAVRLVIDQVGATGATSEGVPRRGEQIDLKVLVKNPSGVPARGVVAELLRRHPDLIAAGEERVEVGEIPAGGWKIARFSLFVRNSYNGPAALPLAVRLRESRGEVNHEGAIAVALDKAAPDVVEYAARAPKAAPAPEAPDLTIDVDQPVKAPVRPDRDAVALVIGIERYGSQVPAVAFAQRDAQAMKRYMRDVLGVEEENIVALADEGATRAGIQVAVERKLKNLVTAGKSNVYVFYAGHGAPDPATKSAYLVPFDGDPNYPAESCYPTARLYEALGGLGAKNVTVMLDACFTGQDGRSKDPQLLLAGARPLMIEALPSAVPAGVTVFAAAGPSQVSSAYPEKRHGLFTYFLLKALRGEELPAAGLTVRKLQGYLADQVSRRARRMGREQSPQLIDPRTEDRPLKEWP